MCAISDCSVVDNRHLQGQRRVELEEVARQGKRDAGIAAEHQADGLKLLPPLVSGQRRNGDGLTCTGVHALSAVGSR